MTGSISVFSSTELQTISKALKEFEKEQRKWIRKTTRDTARPLWQEAVRGNVQTRLQTRVLSDTARVQVSDQNVTMTSGSVGRALSKNGPKPRDLISATEFGAASQSKIQSRSSKGKTYTRRMGNAFGPVNPTGNAVYPAAADVIPKLASLWVSTTIRSLHEAIEEGT